MPTLDHAKPFHFSNDENYQALEFLEKSGLKKNQKWVCIANRTNSHNLKLGTSDKFLKRDTNRNYPINLFSTAVERLIKEGYYIFRIGKFTDDRIEKKIQGYKDTSLDNNNFNDFIQCYLLANAEFSLIPSNGITSIPLLYQNKNFSVLNTPELLFRHMFYYKIRLPYLPKIVFSSLTNEVINIKDYYNHKLYIDINNPHINAEKYIFKNNTEEDLNDLIDEIMSLNIRKYSKKENEIRKIFLNNLKNILPKKYHINLDLNYGLPCVKFLEKNSSIFLN